jgi:FkbM family methyltransferase
MTDIGALKMDRHWIEIIDYLNTSATAGKRRVPAEMVDQVRDAVGFDLEGEADVAFSVVHKGQLDRMAPALLAHVLIEGVPILANDVFVVMEHGRSGIGVSRHLGALSDSLAASLGAARANQALAREGIGTQFVRKMLSGLAVKSVPAAAMAKCDRPIAYMGNNTILTALSTGQKIYLDAQDISLTPHILFDGHWEKWITKAFLDVVRPGMRVVDIGANCGYFTLLACKAVTRSGSVVAIDANPRMCELMENSVSVNGYHGRAKVVQAAVMAEEGILRFAVPRRYKGSASYVREALDFTAFNETHEVIEVRAAPLELLAGPERIDVLKIDAEGAEPIILKAALPWLSTMEGLRMIVEYAPISFAAQMAAGDFLDMIERAGFRISVIDETGVPRQQSRDWLLNSTFSDLFLEKV